jgi:acyl-CoA thioesterase I
MRSFHFLPRFNLASVLLAEFGMLSGSALLATEPAGFLRGLADGYSRKIVTYGTSLTASAAWPARLQTRLRQTYGRKAKVVNAAGNSKDSRWGCENLTERVLRLKPDVVFIEFAINDALASSKLAPEESAKNLTQMIDHIHTARPDCEVIVMIMNPPTGDALKKRPNIHRYEKCYRTVAIRQHCRLLDFSPLWKRMILRQPTRWNESAPDGLHPNAKAQDEVILPKLYQAIGLTEEAARH